MSCPVQCHAITSTTPSRAYGPTTRPVNAAVLERRDVDDKIRMGDPDDVWALFDIWVAQVEGNADKPGMVGLYTAMTVGAIDGTHPAHPWLHGHLTFTVDGVTDALERGKEVGTVAADAPSRQLARTVVALSDGIQVQWLCARADAEAAGETPDRTPVHGGEPVDMAAQMRLLLGLIRSRWEVRPAADGAPPLAGAGRLS